MELPTTGETMDNVVAFWKPARPLKGGEALAFGYRLHWAARSERDHFELVFDFGRKLLAPGHQVGWV